MQQAAETYSGYQGLLGLQADEFANLTAAEKEAEGRYAVWKTLLELQEKVIDWTTGPLLSRQDNSVRPAEPDSVLLLAQTYHKYSTDPTLQPVPCTKLEVPRPTWATVACMRWKLAGATPSAAVLVSQCKLADQFAALPQVRLKLETIRADVEEFGGKAYRMGKGSKDDAVVALLKDQLDEFKQVLQLAHAADHIQQRLCTFTLHKTPFHAAAELCSITQGQPGTALHDHDADRACTSLWHAILCSDVFFLQHVLLLYERQTDRL